MPAAPSLKPTWNGYVGDTKEALILFEAAIGGKLQRVVRRPHDRERAGLIKSGSIFIYEESASGIKRWTDGVPWSPSRILNNFLIYRELEKPFPPGEKKRATKKAKRDPRASDPYQRAGNGEGSRTSNSPPNSIVQSANRIPLTPTGMKPEMGIDRDAERLLVGSLTDSYQFKPAGLVKKTMSVRVDEISYHLVSYYTPDDVKADLLPLPSADPVLCSTSIRPDLLHRQNFRAPLEEQPEDPVHNAYRVQASDHFGSPTSYVAGHAYVPQTSIPASSSYYTNALPMPYQMQHPVGPQSYMPSTSRPLMTPTTAESYYATAPATSTEHFLSYPDQRQPYHTQNFYTNQSMHPWPERRT